MFKIIHVPEKHYDAECSSVTHTLKRRIYTYTYKYHKPRHVAESNLYMKKIYFLNNLLLLRACSKNGKFFFFKKLNLFLYKHCGNSSHQIRFSDRSHSSVKTCGPLVLYIPIIMSAFMRFIFGFMNFWPKRKFNFGGGLVKWSYGYFTRLVHNICLPI